MGAELDIFFPYLLLLICIIIGCVCYRIARVGSLCFNRSEDSWDWDRCVRVILGPGSRSQQNLDVPAGLEESASMTGVESLLRRNIANAVAAGLEARRLAAILATRRGISTEECLESVRATQENSSRALIFNFDDEDLPPTYDECVGSTVQIQIEDSKSLD